MSNKKTIMSLTKNEMLLVAGGGLLDELARSLSHMGEDRIHPVKCYGANEIAERGWSARDWAGAVWFCCSGDKGDYFHVAMGNKYRNCKTGKEGMLSVSVPESLKDVAATEL